MNEKAVVIVDGDIPSIVLATELIQKRADVNIMSFKNSYSNPKRLEMIKEFVKQNDLTHHEIDLTEMSYMFENPLTEFLFITTYQIALASRIGADIYSPVYKDDKFGNFPAMITKGVYLGSNHQIRLQIPYLRCTLKQVIKIGLDNGTNFTLTWSCKEQNIEKPCNKCSFCLERHDLFTQLNYRDPGNPQEAATLVSAVDNRSKIETPPTISKTLIPEVIVPEGNPEAIPQLALREAIFKTAIDEAASDALPSDQRDQRIDIPADLNPLTPSTPDSVK